MAPSAEIQALLREYRGPLYELGDERLLGAQYLESTGLWPPQDGRPTRLDHVTIASGRPDDGGWLKVTTSMLARRQSLQFYLGFALLIGQVASGTACADARVGGDRRWSVAQAAPVTSSSVLLDNEPVSSSHVEADLASVGNDAAQRLAVFAESVDLPDIQVVIWGDAVVWPLPLQTVPEIRRYLSS